MNCAAKIISCFSLSGCVKPSRSQSGADKRSDDDDDDDVAVDIAVDVAFPERFIMGGAVPNGS